MIKIALELDNYTPGVGASGPWVRLNGTKRDGNPVTISFFGPVATALGKQLGQIVPFGKTVAEMRLHLEVKAEQREGKEYKDANTGVVRRWKYYSGTEFDIQLGSALELAKVRTDAARLLREIEVEKVSGRDLADAFRKLAAFAARTGEVTVDLSYLNELELTDDLPADTDTPEASAEAQALERYEREDRTNGLTAAIEEAPSLHATAEHAAEEASAPEEAADASSEANLEGGVAVEDDGVAVSADQKFVASASDEISDTISRGLAVSTLDPLEVDNEIDFGDDGDFGDDDTDDGVDYQASSEPETAPEVKSAPAERPAAETRPAPAAAATAARPLPGRPVSAPAVANPRPAGASAPQATAPSRPQAPVPVSRPLPPMARPMARPGMPGPRG